MDVNTEFYTYWTVLLIAFLISIASFRKLGLPLKFISLLLGYDVLSEMVAHLATVRYHNNMPVYHISVPVTALFTSLYYNYSVPAFRQYHIGWLVAVGCIVASVLNTALLQPLNTFNSNSLLLIGCSTIGMALFTFCKIFLAGNLGVALWKNVHFLISLVLLFNWSGTMATWFVLTDIEEENVPWVFLVVWLVNILTYSGMGTIFFMQSKKYNQ